MSPPRKLLTPEQEGAFISDWNDGISLKVMAEKNGVSPAWISQHVSSLGIKMRHRKNKWPDDVINRFKTDWINGVSRAKMGERYNLKPASILWKAKKLGLTEFGHDIGKTLSASERHWTTEDRDKFREDWLSKTLLRKEVGKRWGVQGRTAMGIAIRMGLPKHRTWVLQNFSHASKVEVEPTITLKCLKCRNDFESKDKSKNRICAPCKGSAAYQSGNDFSECW